MPPAHRKPPVHPVKVELAIRGETQRSFASRIGVAYGTLNQVLNGHSAPWPSLTRRIAAELGKSEGELFAEHVQ